MKNKKIYKNYKKKIPKKKKFIQNKNKKTKLTKKFQIYLEK